MPIQAVGSVSNQYNPQNVKKVNFGNTPAAEAPKADKVEIGAEKAAKKGSWGKAIASFFITGLGQMCDGRAKDGFKQLGSEIGLEVLGGAAFMLGMSAKNKVAQIAGGIVGIASGLASLGVKIYSIVDAYKGGKN